MTELNMPGPSIKTIAGRLKDCPFTALRAPLVMVTGDPLGAMVLDRMIFWQQRASDPEGWVWKSAAEMSKELYGLFKEGKIRKVLQSLVGDGLLECRQSKRRARVYEYRVVVGELDQRLSGKVDGAEAAVSPRKPVHTTEEGILTTEGPVLTECGTYIETTKTTKERIDFRSVCQTEEKETPETQNGDTEQRESNPRTRDQVSADSTAEAELALRQGVALARAAIWRHVDREVTDKRRFDEVFGSDPGISWTSAEKRNLRQLEEFCSLQWPDIEPADAVGALIRGTFHPQGKPFKIIAYWAKYASATVTLRPWLKLGGKEEEQRRDFLLELATSPGVKRAIRRIRQRGTNGHHSVLTAQTEAQRGESAGQTPSRVGSTSDAGKTGLLQRALVARRPGHRPPTPAGSVPVSIHPLHQAGQTPAACEQEAVFDREAFLQRLAQMGRR